METIILAIVAAVPSIAAVISIISSVLKMTKSNDNIGAQVIEKMEEFAVELKNTKEMEDLKHAVQVLSQSNQALQKKYNELLTEITKIRHEEE